MLYSLSKLIKAYDGRVVLDIPDLKIDRNIIHGLLGPNGAGKTTLLHLLAFIETPTSGRMRFNGEPVKPTESYLQQLRRDVVLVDQQPILFTTTVYKNLEFGLRIRGVAKKQRQLMIAKALELVGMESYTHARAWTLSGGETQRIALARAIILKPDILLCDEPTASVDTENQAIIIRILKQISREENMTVLFTTHDRLQAVALADRLLHLDHGRLTDIPSENIYNATCRPKDSHHIICDIQGILCLTMPVKRQNARQGNFRIMIHPERLSIADADKTGVRPRTNAQWLTGDILQITAERSKRRIIVDVGVPMTLLVESDSQPVAQVGSQVAIGIPNEAIQILPES